MKTNIFLLLCIFSIVTLTAHAQTAEKEYTFTFIDELNNSQGLILGKDPFGTDGIDTLFGEEFVPQVPPGEFGVRFQLPPDTSITTIKDIRFGCYWATDSEHLIDINYQTGSSSMSVFWEWDSVISFALMEVMFINPYNGQIIASYSWLNDSSHFYIPPSLDKIKIWTIYDGSLSWEEYEVISPNGGELIEGGENYEITWLDNQFFPWFTIEFSCDSGETWEIINDMVSTTNSGYNWQAPNISSEKCLIRLGNYPCRYDVSDSTFTIMQTVSIETEKTLLTEYSLSQNYPNPFNPKTKISYTVPQTANVTLNVYDILGNEIAVLVNEQKSIGNYEVEFNAINLPNGIYFYRLQAGSFVETKKMILMK